MQEITITTQLIQLDQLLKWEGLIETGGQIRPMLDEGLILVNGQKATERRKKIHPGDMVEIKGVGIWKIIAE
jgi:ribosome-associated protein